VISFHLLLLVSFSLLLRSLLLLLLLSGLVLRRGLPATLTAAGGHGTRGSAYCRALARVIVGNFADDGTSGGTSSGTSRA
jgi:hypothetical protein